jgi:hypothetical protein
MKGKRPLEYEEHREREHAGVTVAENSDDDAHNAGAFEGSPDDILIPEQIMKRLQLATRAQLNELTRARCKHPIPVFRIGKGVRIRRSRLEQWITEEENMN